MADDLRTLLGERERNNIKLVGIHSGGVWLAAELCSRLGDPELGTLDISFYRDDFTKRGINPKVKPTDMDFEVEGQHLILIDDVLMSGRTVRAAMNELFDFGRPASITLVVLFDVGQRELPVSPDICGETLALGPLERVELHGPAPLTAEILRVD
ncbi:MAG: bifunctional pyr operon transcriptional regulator/uracil phosphoribosyltransferase PyrR [Alcanivoracaceae bacterium]|nr:bifunctional pyr operon transcriptional regulator/uracil phosphoribosyltransferase PyrR [Alcanivoracaceae bacterium]